MSSKEIDNYIVFETVSFEESELLKNEFAAHNIDFHLKKNTSHPRPSKPVFEFYVSGLDFEKSQDILTERIMRAPFNFSNSLHRSIFYLIVFFIAVIAVVTYIVNLIF